jgi:hypothetical protein
MTRVVVAMRVFLVALPGLLQAAPVALAESGFSGAEILVAFDGFPAGTSLTTDFVFAGVVFGFGLFAAAEPGAATNFSDPFLTLPLTVEFLSPVNRAGFLFKGAFGDVPVLTALDSAGNPAGSVFFLVSDEYAFIGLEDQNGFSRLWIDSQGPFLIRDLQFEGEPVPEPSGLAALLLGMAWLGFVRRRRQLFGSRR